MNRTSIFVLAVKWGVIVIIALTIGACIASIGFGCGPVHPQAKQESADPAVQKVADVTGVVRTYRIQVDGGYLYVTSGYNCVSSVFVPDKDLCQIRRKNDY